MEIILSTRNPSKAEQIRAVFAGSGISVMTLSEAGIEGEAVEDGATLEENSLKKALFAWEYSGRNQWTMADDTGIFIKSLDGAPGIKAARWAGETATTEEITQYTLRRLLGASDRSATFKTVVAVVSPDGSHRFFEGEVQGRLLDSPRTKPQPKMPYSPLFVPDGQDLTWAEMTTEFENSISHRGQAFRKVKEFLEEAV